MQAVRISSLAVMVLSVIAAAFVIINNVVEPGDVPGLLQPIINALPEQGTGTSTVLTVGVVAVAIIASIVHTKAKKSLEKKSRR